MADFSHFQKLEVSPDDTSTYKFSDIVVNGVSPVVIVAPATEANKPYYNALLKSQAKRVRQLSRGKVDADMVAENRQEDRRLFPAHVVKGFVDGTVIDSDGKAVKFNRDVAADFVDALPDDIFDAFRNWCATTDNFRSSEGIEVDAKAKN